ncbi:hypothetical protein [Paenibacillus tarimensis]|uniref:hypothetical protein n=1 Tax=Paenibacillus tarimensis TaxID=416012 RepID=UPI001F2364F3|nr:hypothetical protein [Paenibacillus tarimensis]MCF2946022.1 hypothetical protein [Paenibacillus tarimensis]
MSEKTGESLYDYLGIYIRREPGFAYDCTPDDAVVFGHTGADGDHFAFSTGEGSIINLDEAPILFIQPMMFGEEVKMVARNLQEFLSAYLSLGEIYILERFDRYLTRHVFKPKQARPSLS